MSNTKNTTGKNTFIILTCFAIARKNTAGILIFSLKPIWMTHMQKRSINDDTNLPMSGP
jgi:hypothetical protein